MLSYFSKGSFVGLNISQTRTPKLQTSEAAEKALSLILSGGIQRMGLGILWLAVYTERSRGIARRRPKSATLHISFAPTSTFLAAKSCHIDKDSFML